jgi:hypothetical protein
VSAYRNIAPALAAKQAIDAGFPAGIFEQALWLHHLHGIVSSGPRHFVLARPVEREAPWEAIADLTRPFDRPNAWYVWIAAGELEAILSAMPSLLDHIGFRRGLKHRPDQCGRVHWHRTCGLRRKIRGLRATLHRNHIIYGRIR